MVKKILIVFSIFMLTVIMAFSYMLISKNSIHKIQSVNIADYKDGYIYGIDMTSDMYYIFRVNTETNEQEFFTYPIELNGNVVKLDNMIWGDEDKLYVHLIQSGKDNFYKETIEYCNFNSASLETVWTIDDRFEGSFFSCNYENNGDFVLITFDKENYVLNRYILTKDGLIEKFDTIKLHKSVYAISIENDSFLGNFFTMSINGDIGLVEENGEVRTIFSNDGSKIGIQNVKFEFEDKDLYFFNIDTGYKYKLANETNYEELELYIDENIIDAETFDIKQMYNVYENKGVYVGVLALEDGRNVPAIYGEKEYVVDELSWTKSYIIFMSLLLFVILSTIFIIYMYIFYKILNKKGGAPVMGIAAMLIIPVILVGIFVLFYFIDNKLPDKKEQKIQQLTTISEIVKEKINIDKFEFYRNKYKVTYNDILEINNGINKFEKINNIDTNSIEYINENIKNNLYFYKDNEIFSASEKYPVGVPMNYNTVSNTYNCMKEAAQNNKVVYTEYNDLTGRYISIFTPIKNNSGEVIGVLETNENILLLEFNIHNNTKTVKRILFIDALIIFILILCVLWINTRPLKALRRAMTEVAKGNLSFRANISGNNEIAVISNKFDIMAELIENRFDEIETFQNKYEAFVPSKLFYILRKKGIKEVYAGDGKNFTATVMSVNSLGYKKAVIEKYDQVFSYSNTYLPKQIPIIHSYGGVIRRIFEGGEETIFTKETQNNVAECAIAIMDKLKYSNEGFSIGIAKQELRFGVIGLPKRMVTVLISEHGSLSWFLQKMASKFGISILITGNAADKIDDFFNRYNIRTIGYIYMTSTNNLEIIYEIINGDTQKRQRLKLDTKKDFEEGVRLFMSKSYEYARKRFIQVLEKDKYDGAAREYVFLCDKSLKGENINPWLDKY